MSAYPAEQPAVLFASPEVPLRRALQWPGEGEAPAATLNMSVPTAQRGEVPPGTGDGYTAARWQDAYYGRIHFYPAAADFGNISSESSLDVLIWVASETETAINAIGAENADGVSLQGVAIGDTLPPFAERPLRAVASSGGAPIFEGALTLETETLPAARLPVFGRRVQVFAYPPDWSAPVRLSRAWQTRRRTALSAGEHRDALAAAPLQSIRYRVLACTQEETVRLKRDLALLRSRTAGFALWPDALRLVEPMPAGAVAVALEAALEDRPYTVGTQVLLYAAPGVWAVREIQSASETTLQIDKPISFDLPAGALAAPLRFGRIEALPQVEHITDETTEATLEFSEQP